MTDVKVPVTEYHVWYPFLLGLPSIRGLIERTDLHIALFIVANGNTAVTQLSEVTIWGRGFKPTINGSTRANNSKVIWIQLLWIERKGRLTESSSQWYWMEKLVTKLYCTEQEWLRAAGLVLKELRDFIRCCIRCTKTFGLRTALLMKEPDNIVTQTTDRHRNWKANLQLTFDSSEARFISFPCFVYLYCIG